MAFISIFVTLALLSSVQLVNGQDPFYTYDAVFAPSTSNFVRRQQGAAIVLGDFLYYDCGDLWQLVDGQLYVAPSNATLSIDLRKAWNNQTIEWDVVNKTEKHVDLIWNLALLWPDPTHSFFYQWGGEWSYKRLVYGTPPNQLAKFQPDNAGKGEWSIRPPTASSLFTNLRRGVQMAFAHDNAGTAYFLGGHTTCRSDPGFSGCGVIEPLGPMISYNASTNVWTNTSAEGITPGKSLHFAQMEHVPFGSPSGVNIIFAGTSAKDPRDTAGLIGLDAIYIHDPVTNKYWTQATTSASGHIPLPRNVACSAKLKGTNGTYEIFLYGGDDPSKPDKDNMEMSDTVWVLSIPSFVWFQADYPSRFMRAGHTCSLSSQSGSQIIVVGGIDRALANGSVKPDPWSNGVNVFDMNGLVWKSEYDPEAPAYKTPKVIRDYLAASGPLPTTWDSTEVQDLFTQADNIKFPPDDSDTDAPPKAKQKVGPIVGGVVGGIVAIALLAVLAWWLRRRRSRKQKQKPKPDVDNIRREQNPMLDVDYSRPGQTSMSDAVYNKPELHNDSQFPQGYSNYRHPSTEPNGHHSQQARYEADSGVGESRGPITPNPHVQRWELPNTPASRQAT